jgi:inositol transport system substrate-binding protein
MEYIGEKLGGKGNIIIMRGADGHEAATMRTEGVKKVITEKYPDIKILAEDTGKWDRALGMSLAENWIQQYGEEIDAFVCNNDEMAIGAVKAIENAGLTGKILTAGVDCTPDALVELKKGTLNFTVFQDPASQGAGGVQAAYDIVMGKSVDKVVWIPYMPVPPEEYDTYAAFWGM